MAHAAAWRLAKIFAGPWRSNKGIHGNQTCRSHACCPNVKSFVGHGLLRAMYRVPNCAKWFGLFANSARTAGPIGMGEALIDVFRPHQDDGAYWESIGGTCHMPIGTILILTRAWPGSQPNAIDRGGGAYNAPPRLTPKPMTAARRARPALERSRRDGSKALLKFFLKGHVSGQGQVKGQNSAFQHFGSQNHQLDSNRPKLDRNTLKG